MKFFIILFTMISFLTTSSPKPGGGNLNPGIYTNEESIEKFQDMRFGLSVHWGPSSLGGKEISWARDKEIPKETYDNFYKEFNPVNFDADAWVQFAKEVGMQYIILTSKHHDGFSLWPSEFTPYNISNTPFKRNIVKELSDACKRGGITFGSYYSILDWYHPDYTPNEHGGPGELMPTDDDTPNFERYFIFMKNQLRELIVDYGAEIIQFDGEWDHTWNHQLGSDLYLYVRKLDDKVIVNSRVDVGRYHLHPETGMWNWSIYAGDFDERERMVDWVDAESHVHGKSEQPWQAWVTIDQAQWSWNETPRLLTADEIIVDLLKTIGDNGNYLINLGPQPNGEFHPDQVAIMKQVGQWVKKYDEAIYGTRGGPFTLEDQYTSTRKGDTIYMFVLNKSLTTVELDTNMIKINSITDYSGSDMDYKSNEKYLAINIPKQTAENIRILKIEIAE